MSVEIHQTAIVSEKAHLGDNVSVGPYAVIEDDVVIGNDCRIMSHVVLAGGTRLGNNNRVFSHAVLGMEPQDLKFSGAKTEVFIGNNNTIREFATIHRGTESTGKTVVGDNNLIMAYCHVAHDNRIGSNIVMANATNLGGHVKLEDWVILGGMVKVHQFCSVGCHSLVGADVKVVKDVAPYTLIGRDPGKVEGLNVIGLRRRGFSADAINELEEFYKIVLHSGLNVSAGLAKYQQREVITDNVLHCIEFIKSSQRGIYN